jgi:RNA polymerase sigma factor (sigma-70 family)
MGTVNASATLEQLVADSSWLRRLALALVKEEATADDVVQDTYTIAATQAPTDGRPLRPWLFRVLTNRARTASRSARRRRGREQAFGELAAAPARPDEIVDRIELQRRLAGFVLGLAAPQRDVVLLHYFEGLTSKEIGERLGIAPGTVRWRLKQAIDELRARLEERSPNRGWVPALAAFTRTAPSPRAALLPKLLFGAFVLLTIFGFVLRSQLGTSVQSGTKTRAARHAPAGSSKVPTIRKSSASATRVSGLVFAAEHRRLEGRVIDGQGHGVVGADVELECGYAGEVKQKQVSGDGGAFSFETDPHCNYLITATKGDSAGQQSWLGPSTMGARGGVRLEGVDRERDEIVAHIRDFDSEWFRTVVQLHRVPQSVIRVVDADTGAPVANAKISTGWIYDDSVSAVTGADGIARVTVPLPAGVTVNADPYATAREVLENPTRPGCEGRLNDRSAVTLGVPSKCDGPSTVTLDVRLHRGIAVSGTVIGRDGKPVADASVVISGPTSAAPAKVIDVKATTDASGRFETKVTVAGRYLLTAERRDLTGGGPVGVDVPAQGRTDLIAHVVPRSTIRGTVVDLGSKPVAGARVSLADGSIPPVVADANGRFTIENVAGAVDIIANHGSDASAFQRLQLEPGQSVDVVLQVGPSGISGVAIDHDGSPVEGAEVWLNLCCDWNPILVAGKRITTDATGRFSFDTPRGDFVLSVKRGEDDDYVDDDDVKVTGGSHDVRLPVP